MPLPVQTVSQSLVPRLCWMGSSRRKEQVPLCFFAEGQPQLKCGHGSFAQSFLYNMEHISVRLTISMFSFLIIRML